MLRVEMSVEDKIAEGKRLIEASCVSRRSRWYYVKGWRCWGRFCAMSGVDPLDASWEDVVACLDAEEMKKTKIEELRSALRLVYPARGMASPADDRRVAVRVGIRVHADVESYPEKIRMLLQLYQRQYLGWCQHHDRDALGGGAEQVAEFLRSLLETIGLRTMRRANMGVSFYLVAMGRPATEHHPLVLAVLEECQKNSAERKPVAFGGAPSVEKNCREESQRRQWETWLEGRGTRFEKATGADALEWLRGFEGQVTATSRVRALSRFYEGADNPFACEEVVQWAREYQSRVRSGEIAKPVRLNRKEQVKAEWAAARAERAAAAVLGVPVGLTREEVERVGVDGGRRLSPSTVNGYAANWALFTDWLKNRDVSLADVVDVHVRVYVEECAGRLSVSGLNQVVSSLGHGFCEHGFQVNPTWSHLVSDYIYNLTLERKESAAQEDPIREAECQVIIDRGFPPGRGPRSLRADLYWAFVVALVKVMYDGMLRGGDARLVRWQDLSRYADGSGSLLIRHSKTDQLGQGEYTYVSATARKYLDLLQDLRRLLGTQERESDLIFGVSVERMCSVIADACADAGLVGRYGTHSMRIGGAQELARAGFGLSMIMQAGRWESPDMPKYYTRGITVAEGAMAELHRMLADGRHKVDVNARGYDVMSAFHAVKYGR